MAALLLSLQKLNLSRSFWSTVAPANPDVAVAVFLHIHQGFCADENIHVVVQRLNLSAEQAGTVLKGYYSVWNILEVRQLVPEVPAPAIFSDSNTRLAAMFGSIGGANSYLDEAAWLLDVYGPLLSDFVAHMSGFLKRVSSDPMFAKAYSCPLDIAGWLASPDTVPGARYLLTAPVISPMLGLIQAMHVVVLYKTLNMSPGDLVSRFNVAIGHSQGLTMAAAFASVTDEASFYAVTERMLSISLAIAVIGQLNFSPDASYGDKSECSLPTGNLSVPMISIRGLTKDMLEPFVAAFNANCMVEDSKVSLALINGRSNIVVSGKPNSIAGFTNYLRKHTALPTEDQSRVQFSLRKPAAIVLPLNMTLPTHCAIMADVVPKVYEVVTAKGWVLNADTLRIRVNAGMDGHDLRDEVDLTKYLIGTPMPHTSSTSVLAGFSAFGKYTRDILDGYGKTVISTSALISDTQSRMGSKADLFKQNISDVFSAPNWQSAFGPRLVQTAHEGQLHIRTRMSLTLGLPPVMVAGMIPTMSNEHFVAAISNAGYHVELAGSGIYTEAGFRKGLRIWSTSLNQWTFQYPSILRMRREGVPITGLCIGASVPSVDVANGIIAELRDAGIRHVAFKPRSVATILQTLAIARANPDFPVIIQWTGVVVVVTIHVRSSRANFGNLQ
ncbi:hypothetical protein DL89DRAFT_318851 [Linderina pennispora]|uniref:Starter acyltransferase (SAT) domain-containing protein n=1 Tax=Linderina pennispora TaxID=61395 RepID=A0A1Y1W5N6_9FUNG|nr:uncharacterized protein DL89DRAFT_318851 [Linderina pennispora]ORX68859.1 hypothetical protein DL89DRAFT_318851 [Linderina pennispora]